MTDSLTVSVLLFVALAIGAVVGWDAWRAWRLKKLSVSQPATESPPQRSDTEGVQGAAGAGFGAASRLEPSFGFDRESLPVSGTQPDKRSEPGLGSIATIDSDLYARVPPPSPRIQTALLLGEQNESAVAGVERSPEVARLPEPSESVGTVSAATPTDVVETPSAQSDWSRGGRSDPSGVNSVEAIEGTRVEPDGVPHHAAGLAATGSPVRLDEPAQPASTARPAPAGVIGEHTDCIALLRFIQPVSCERVIALAQSFRRAGSKPVAIEVAEFADGLSPAWGAPRAGQFCALVRFGLLLANRSGSLNALEYTDFAQRVREIASALGVGIEIPDMNAALARARELDAQSAQLDATICLNVDAGEVLGPSQLAALAAPLAIVERGNNRYARLTARGETMFSVSLGERSNRLTFMLDLPRVDPQARAFDAMLESAKVAARRLPGRLVDDEGRTLNDRGLEQIARAIDQRQQALGAAGLAPGTAAALRVFN